mgnify:CR=1 FL=1
MLTDIQNLERSINSSLTTAVKKSEIKFGQLYIDINIEESGNGAKIFLTSKEIVKDPFLDLLIQIDSEKGRVYREYTILLDPPSPKAIKKEER